jgi:hypothetical protein
MPKAVIIDKGVAEQGFRGLHTRVPPYMIGPMEAQTARNFHVNDGSLDKCNGYEKIFNTAQPPPGVHFRNHNENEYVAASSGVGVVSYLRIPHHADFNLGTQWTIELFVRIPEIPSADVCVISKGDRSLNTVGFEICISPARLIRIEYDDSVGAAQTVAAVSALTVGQGYHVSFRRNATALEVWIDGAQDNTAVVSANANITNTQPILVGMRLLDGNSDADIGPEGGHGQDYFKGTVDDFRIWSTNRSNAEIADNAETELDSSDNSNLEGYWKFNEGTGYTSVCDPNATNPSVKTAEFKWIGPRFVEGLVDESLQGAWEFDGYSTVGIIGYHTIYENLFSPAGAATWTVEFNWKVSEINRQQTLLFMGDETLAGPWNTVVFWVEQNSANNWSFKLWDGVAFQTLVTNLVSVQAKVGNHYHIAIVRDTPGGSGYRTKLAVWNITDYPAVTVAGPGYDVKDDSGGLFGVAYPGTATRITVGMFGTNSDYISTNTPDPANGTMDELRIWSTDRSNYPSGAAAPQDLVLHHGNGAVFGDDPGLVGYWSFDDESFDWEIGDPVVTRNISVNSNSILGFPNSYPPVWTNGLLKKTALDSDGTTLRGKPEPINYQSEFTPVEGNSEVLIGAGCNLYRATGGGLVEVEKGLTKGTLIDSVIYNNRLHLCNEEDYPRTYFDQTIFFMGLNRPGPVPFGVIDLGGTAAWRNNRAYVYTHYDSRTGRESTISGRSFVVGMGAGFGMAYILLFPTANPRVTHLRVYATQSTPGTPSVTYYRLGEVPNKPIVQTGTVGFLWGATGYIVDDVPDTTLALRPRITVFRQTPEKFKYMTLHKDRLYGVCDRYPNRLFFSHLGNPEGFRASQFQDYEENDGDEITALGQVRAKFIVGKNTSMWEQPVGGNTGLPLKPEARHRDHGVSSHFALINVDVNAVAYLSTKGFYLYDGEQHRLISREIDPVVRALDESLLNRTYGAHYRTRHSCLWAVVTDAGVLQVLSFDYRTGSWCRRTNWNARVLSDMRNVRGADERFLIGTDWGYSMLYDEVTAGEENNGAGSATPLTGTATGGGTTYLEDTSAAAWQALSDDKLRGLTIMITDAVTAVEEVFTIAHVNKAADGNPRIYFERARGSAVAAGDTYRIAYIDFLWESRDEFHENTMNRDLWQMCDVLLGTHTTGTLTIGFKPEGINANTKTKTVALATAGNRKAQIFLDLLATFLSTSFSNKEPNVPVSIRSYALSVLPGEAKAQVDLTP